LAGLSVLVATAAVVVSVAVPRFIAVSLRATCVNYVALSVLALALWLGTGPHWKFVNLRILSFYGFISYGLYLIHALIFHLYNDVSVKFAPSLYAGHAFGKCLLRLVVTLIIATAVASISRATFEEFFLRMKDKTSL